jgi:hypothetical protein
LTAGHCVHDGKTSFHTNLVFVPNTKTEGNSLKKLNPDHLLADGLPLDSLQLQNGQEENGAGFARDTGIVKISNQAGRTISQAVGAKLTPIYNSGRNLNAMALGYPSNIGGGNKKMVQATGTMSLGSTAFSPNTQKLPSTMTFGASGGPLGCEFKPSQWIELLYHFNKSILHVQSIF